MNPDEIEKNVGDVLEEDGLRADENGKYHPSAASGCSLKLLLNKVSNSKTVLNSWLFQGSAVHYYLEESGLMDEMLYRSGYHPIDTEYEVHREYQIADGVTMTGTCDILTQKDDATTIFDMKYSTIKPEYKHGRLMKYFSQLNTYAHMFGADEYALIMIHSKSRDLVNEGINVLTGEPNKENWELVKEKVINVHGKLEDLGWEPGDVLWTLDDLSKKDDEFWKDLLSGMKKEQMPAYEEECKYCDHSDYCPIKQNKLASGFASFKGGSP